MAYAKAHHSVHLCCVYAACVCLRAHGLFPQSHTSSLPYYGREQIFLFKHWVYYSICLLVRFSFCTIVSHLGLARVHQQLSKQNIYIFAILMSVFLYCMCVFHYPIQSRPNTRVCLFAISTIAHSMCATTNATVDC